MHTIIKTRYFGPIGFRGSKIVAKCGGRQATFYYDCSMSSEDNHTEAARKLGRKLGLDFKALQDIECIREDGTRREFVVR